jgi:hypothetical protein
MRWHQHYCLPALLSNPPPVLVAATEFESCKLTVRAVHGADCTLQRKAGRLLLTLLVGTGSSWMIGGGGTWPAPPSEPNTIAVPRGWRVEFGAGSGAAWESGGVALTRGGL